jgi:hypothetical protein
MNAKLARWGDRLMWLLLGTAVAWFTVRAMVP